MTAEQRSSGAFASFKIIKLGALNTMYRKHSIITKCLFFTKSKAFFKDYRI